MSLTVRLTENFPKLKCASPFLSLAPAFTAYIDAVPPRKHRITHRALRVIGISRFVSISHDNLRYGLELYRLGRFCQTLRTIQKNSVGPVAHVLLSGHGGADDSHNAITTAPIRMVGRVIDPVFG